MSDNPGGHDGNDTQQLLRSRTRRKFCFDHPIGTGYFRLALLTSSLRVALNKANPDPLNNRPSGIQWPICEALRDYSSEILADLRVNLNSDAGDSFVGLFMKQDPSLSDGFLTEARLSS